MTTTVVAVMHDAHVRARRAAFIAQGAAFMAAYQTVCCFIAAVALQCVARRAVRADRAATRAANHAATKAANAVKVARKEAAEQYASRVAKRAAKKAANAPMVRAAKLHAASVAKAVKAANAVRLHAVRATRAAAKATAVVKAAMVAIDRGVALSVAPATTVVAPAPVNVNEVVAFLAMTPCLCALWFYATFDIAARAADKEAAKAANKVHATVKVAHPTLNSAEVRERITARDRARAAGRAAQRAAEAALLAAMVHKHQATGLSLATIEARAAQGAAQREANATRKAGMPVKAPRPHVVIVRSGPAKNKGPKRVRVVRVHTVESALAQAAKKAAIVKAKEDKEIAKARRWALRKAAFAARKAAMEQIASDAWMNKGVWLPEDLLRAANDWSYAVRVNAFKEARNIAYAKAPVVGGAK